MERWEAYAAKYAKQYLTRSQLPKRTPPGKCPRNHKRHLSNRIYRGESPRFTPAEAKAIRDLIRVHADKNGRCGEMREAICKRYGVSSGTISRVLHGHGSYGRPPYVD